MNFAERTTDTPKMTRAQVVRFGRAAFFNVKRARGIYRPALAINSGYPQFVDALGASFTGNSVVWNLGTLSAGASGTGASAMMCRSRSGTTSIPG